MNNDLISREALKEVFNGYYSGIGSQPKFTLGACLQLIDNAPTVEPFEPDYVGAERVAARQRGYADGYHNGMEIGKTLNPKIKQGEWVRKVDVIQSIAKQYSDHNELVPIWLSIGDMKGGAE